MAAREAFNAPFCQREPRSRFHDMRQQARDRLPLAVVAEAVKGIVDFLDMQVEQQRKTQSEHLLFILTAIDLRSVFTDKTDLKHLASINQLLEFFSLIV
jgi:hypothetical protein